MDWNGMEHSGLSHAAAHTVMKVSLLFRYKEHKMRRMVLLLLVACLLPGMVVVSAQSEASEARPVIVDSDMASDDWMALAYLLSRSDIAIQAITVTGTGFAT